MDLTEMVKAEKARRAKLEADEKQSFGIDTEAITEVKDEVTVVKNTITEEFPLHYKVLTLAERMGMELRIVQEDGTHAWVYQGLILYLNTETDVVRIDEKFVSGTLRSQMVHFLEEKQMKKIETDMARILFTMNDHKSEAMSETHKVAWNRLYSKQQGEWK
jgi:hypothetical protein